MTYPPPEPAPTDPPPPAHQEPYVPGAHLPGYTMPTDAAAQTHGYGTAPETPGYSARPEAYGQNLPPGANPEAYGQTLPPGANPGTYWYGAPGAAPGMYGYGAQPGVEYYGYSAPQPYYPGYPYGYAPPRETEGLAIAALIVSCAAVLGLCTWGVGGLLGIVGAILGHVARRRIRLNGRSGDGMALAGIIVGWILAAVCVVMLVVSVVLVAHDFNSTENT
jgi:hypothetical protein